jgi:PAS domain S-box-containing protein
MEPKSPNDADEQPLDGFGLIEAIFEHFPDRIYLKDTKSRFVRINRCLAQRLGLENPAAAIGKTDFDFQAPEKAQEFFEDEQRIIRTGEPLINKVEEQVLPDGSKAWASVTKVAVRDRTGRIVGVLGMNREITGQKTAEEALRRSRDELEQRVTERTAEFLEANSQLEAMLENIPDRIYFKDSNSRFLKISQALAKRMGLPDPKLAFGLSDFDFYQKEKAEEFFRDEQHILERGQSLIGKIEKQITADGVVTWASVTKVPIRNAVGKIIGLVGINRDITAQQEAEEALRESRDELERRVVERTRDLSSRNQELDDLIAEVRRAESQAATERHLLRTIIDNLPDAIYIKDSKACKTVANPADLKNFGCKTEAEAIGKSDFDLFPPDVAAKFYADDQLVLSGKPVHNREESFVDEGRTHWLLTTKLPLRDQSGSIIGLIGIGRDITHIKEAEQKLDATHRELMKASRSAGMAEVATGILHNVGNVLNSVNVSAQLIKNHITASKVVSVCKLGNLLEENSTQLATFLTSDERGRMLPAYVSGLSQVLQTEKAEQLRELSLLIRNIEHITEIVSMQQAYANAAGVTERVKVEEIVRDAVHVNDAALQRHNIQFTCHFEPELPELIVDRHKVVQILINLVSNAKYACDAGKSRDKRIQLGVVRRDNSIRISVTDNGIGIPQENLTRIFQYGFTTKKEGHGFGLHSSALAAKQLGGALRVFSGGPETGAEFVLEIPVMNHGMQ